MPAAFSNQSSLSTRADLRVGADLGERAAASRQQHTVHTTHTNSYTYARNDERASERSAADSDVEGRVLLVCCNEEGLEV